MVAEAGTLWEVVATEAIIRLLVVREYTEAVAEAVALGDPVALEGMELS
jgi:hypothetical protein